MNNEHSTPALPEDNTIEREIAQYGVTYGAVQINRTVAEKLAQDFVGTIVDMRTDLTTPFLRQVGLSPCIVDLSQPRMRIIDYRMVQLLLDEAMIKGIERLLVHPEQEYTEEMFTMYLTDTLNLVANVLPEEMRLSVRRIVLLYKQFTEEH